MKPTDFAFLLSNFLGKYLNGQRNLSANTVKAYRDTFVLLLTFLKEVRALPAERVTIRVLDTAIIHEFLHWLGEQRGNSVSTQNQRLAAIHAFFKYAQGEIPELMFHCQTILAIPFKRAPKPVVGYLAQSSMKQILAAPDVSTSSGRRDLALLCILYDTGARVSELCDICVRDVRLEEPAVIRLTGKGRKQRYVPIMSNSTSVLKGYMEEHGMLYANNADLPLFTNRSRKKLTRAGVSYILKKHVNQAEIYESQTRITPHILRHTKAMHLIQAGVNLVYIRDLLGHSDTSTTEIYARADTEMKRAALEKMKNSAIPDSPSWNQDKGLMEWLATLGK